MLFRRLVLLLVLSSTLLASTASQQRAQKQKPSSKAQAGICRRVIESGHKEAQKAQEE